MIVLEVVEGPDLGRREILARGNILHLGRDPRAEIHFGSDLDVAAIHCSIQSLGDACRINDLTSDGSTHVNGESIAQTIAAHDDRITIGHTTLRISVEPDSVEEPVPEPPRAETTVAFCERMELPAPTDWPDGLDAECTPLEYYRSQRERKDTDMSLPLLAHWLPKDQAVAWACACIRQSLETQLTAAQSESLELAEAWSKQPSEELRRQAETATEVHHGNTSIGMLVRSVFYSDVSLAPVGFPPVPPADNLTGKAITVSLRFAAIETGRPDTDQVLNDFLVLAESTLDLDAIQLDNTEL